MLCRPKLTQSFFPVNNLNVRLMVFSRQLNLMLKNVGHVLTPSGEIVRCAYITEEVNFR